MAWFDETFATVTTDDNKDWFAAQITESNAKPQPTARPRTSVRVVTLSVTNRTCYPWTVTLHGSKLTDARAASLNDAALHVEPNDRASRVVARLIVNERLRLASILLETPLGKGATMVLRDDVARELSHATLAGATDLSLRIDWGESDTLVGHPVPLLRTEVVSMQDAPSLTL